jgi:hypothetical protein
VLLRRHYDRRSGVVVHESMCACSVSVCAHLQERLEWETPESTEGAEQIKVFMKMVHAVALGLATTLVQRDLYRR